MANTLNSQELEHYRNEGYVFPRRVMSEDEAAGFADAFCGYEEQAKGPLESAYKHKLHLVAGWAADLVHHPGDRVTRAGPRVTSGEGQVSCVR